MYRSYFGVIIAERTEDNVQPIRGQCASIDRHLHDYFDYFLS
jgi:hypothetical protein